MFVPIGAGSGLGGGGGGVGQRQNNKGEFEQCSGHFTALERDPDIDILRSLLERALGKAHKWRQHQWQASRGPMDLSTSIIHYINLLGDGVMWRGGSESGW